jgi:putative phosphoribosyl transferase
VIFTDRVEAGRRLAEALVDLKGEDVVVLGIPRGGVVVAAEVARAHGWPLDTVIPRKIRAPGNPELGLGAIAPGVRVLDERMLDVLGVSEDYLEREIAEEEQEIERRSAAYRSGRAAVDVKDKVVAVVDDGIATGGTATAAVRWAKAQGARRVILAVPVAPAEGVRSLSREADDVVCLETPEPFFAVGQWYRDFPQTEDDEVVQLLEETRQGRDNGPPESQ